MREDQEMLPAGNFEYDVALSYAGEDRSHANALADVLKGQGVKVFFDKYETPFFWGKDLYTHLSDVYQNKARYCVIFISKSYANKVWTKHELSAAQDRALKENKEYILPIRLDNTEIPGILSTTAYLNWHRETVDGIVDTLLQKLGKGRRHEETADDSTANTLLQTSGNKAKLHKETAIEVLGDRYQLQDPIGRGGMATIYRGRDLRMDRIVAIKVLREVYSTDPKFVTRFQREAKAASALQHPNIVQVFDSGDTDGNYFIVMELVEGTDLRRYLRSRGVLDIDRAIIIAHDVALGLGAAHRRGIVHRDVKPQNVLVGRGDCIKLTDFGIASVYKDINAERLTTAGIMFGMVQYSAPEQAQGEIVSPATDVYALGIVMYEMLTGHTPFNGDTPVAVAMQHIQDPPVPPSQYNPSIPIALEEIILRCLEKIPEMRFRDGSQLALALETLGDNVASAISSPTSNKMLPRGVARNYQRDSRFATIITVLILLSTLLLLGVSIYLAAQLGVFHLPFLH